VRAKRQQNKEKKIFQIRGDLEDKYNEGLGESDYETFQRKTPEVNPEKNRFGGIDISASEKELAGWHHLRRNTSLNCKSKWATEQ